MIVKYPKNVDREIQARLDMEKENPSVKVNGCKRFKVKLRKLIK